MTTKIFAVPLALIAAASAPDLPTPDILPMGMKGVAWESRFDAGPFAPSLCREVSAAANDTLQAIASRECPEDPAAIDAIRLLNPKVVDPVLEAGTKVVVPPGRRPADSRAASRPVDPTAEGLLFQVAWRIGATGPEPLVAGRPLPRFRGGARLVFVPRDRLRAFFEVNWRRMRPFVVPEGFVASDAILAPEVVPEDDPAARVVLHVTLRDAKDGRIPVDQKLERFDAAGKPLGFEEPRRVELPGSPRKGAALAPLVILGASAIAGSIAIAWRRRKSKGGAR